MQAFTLNDGAAAQDVSISASILRTAFGNTKYSVRHRPNNVAQLSLVPLEDRRLLATLTAPNNTDGAVTIYRAVYVLTGGNQQTYAGHFALADAAATIGLGMDV